MFQKGCSPMSSPNKCSKRFENLIEFLFQFAFPFKISFSFPFSFSFSFSFSFPVPSKRGHEVGAKFHHAIPSEILL